MKFLAGLALAATIVGSIAGAQVIHVQTIQFGMTDIHLLNEVRRCPSQFNTLSIVAPVVSATEKRGGGPDTFFISFASGRQLVIQSIAGRNAFGQPVTSTSCSIQ